MVNAQGSTNFNSLKIYVKLCQTPGSIYQKYEFIYFFILILFFFYLMFVLFFFKDFDLFICCII